MRSALAYLAFVQDENLVGTLYSRQPERDYQRGPSPHQDLERFIDPGLQLTVYRAGRLGQDEHYGVGSEGAGEGDELTLADRDRCTPLTRRLIVPRWKPLDEGVSPYAMRRCSDLVVCYLTAAEGDVAP